MPRFGRSPKEQLLDERAAAWAGLRVVVADVETTGLNTNTSRIVSVALAEIQAGRVLAGFASLVAPPGVERIGASEIHGITIDTLRAAAAPPFSSVASMILDRLTARDGETVLFAGHNALFDALMLHAEFARLSSAFPAIGILDTKTLAARAGVAAGNLHELAVALGLVATDEHTAISDANITANALLLLTDRIRSHEPNLNIETLASTFDPSLRVNRRGSLHRTRDEEVILTPEHIAAHSEDLTDPANLDTGLGICVDEDCADLIERIGDALTTPASGETVAEWCWLELDRPGIRRSASGRLLTGISIALERADDPRLIQGYYDSLTEWLPTVGNCSFLDACDRCADEENDRPCRFAAVPYQLITAFMTRDRVLDEERADLFLPFPDSAGPRKPRPAGWFGQLLRSGDLDPAGFGAQLAAQAGARSRIAGRELAMLRFAWESGSRNAVLADRLSKRLVATPSEDGTRSNLAEALDVCNQALAPKPDASGRIWQRLRDRRSRIRAQQAATPRRAPATVRNKRPPRPSRYRLTDRESAAPGAAGPILSNINRPIPGGTSGRAG